MENFSISPCRDTYHHGIALASEHGWLFQWHSNKSTQFFLLSNLLLYLICGKKVLVYIVIWIRKLPNFHPCNHAWYHFYVSSLQLVLTLPLMGCPLNNKLQPSDYVHNISCIIHIGINFTTVPRSHSHGIVELKISMSSTYFPEYRVYEWFYISIFAVPRGKQICAADVYELHCIE